MKLTLKRSLENMVFSSEISFSGFGSDDLSEQEEKEMFENYSPSINIGGKFSGKFKFENGEAIEDDTATDVVEFIENSSVVYLTENFNITHSVPAKDMQLDAAYTQLDSVMKISQARAVLFENTIRKRISDELARIKLEGPTSFDSQDNKEVEITI